MILSFRLWIRLLLVGIKAGGVKREGEVNRYYVVGVVGGASSRGIW